MSESLFDIFGDHLTRQVKNVARQPLSNIENMGKTVSAGPVKMNEPLKKAGEIKKSFMNNIGASLPMTPMQRVLSPKNRNLNSVTKTIKADTIYSDADRDERILEELQFTKPKNHYDNFHSDLLDYFTVPEDRFIQPPSPGTPPPQLQLSSSFDCSYDTDFLIDSSINSSTHYEEDNLPDIF